MNLEPFSVPFSQRGLDYLQDRLRRTSWPDEAVNLHFLQSICHYWRTEFDWKLQGFR
jgi:hypothetical protein